jgi:hypothetical protein
MKKIFSIALLAILLHSCTDFLTEENRSNGAAATDTYYATATGYKSLVNVCYASLRVVWGNEPYLFSAGTDLFERGKNPAPAGISTYLTLGATETSVSDFYTRCYAGIQKCNIAIYYSDKTEQNTELPKLKAEAIFLRALYYFNLVQQFGGVPIVEEMISSPVTSFERKSTSEVYSFIISQMEGLLTTPIPDKSTGANFGRVDKRTLNHFLSKVYLSRGWEAAIGSPADFDKAISYGKAAIGADKLTLSFADVFKVGNEKNAEIIFSVQWDATSMVSNTTDGNMQGGMFGTQFDPPLINKNPYILGTLVPGRRLYEIYKSDDERYQVSFLSTIYTYALDYYFMTPAQLATTNITHYYPPHWATSDADIAAWRAIDPARRTATKVHKFDNVMFTDVNNYARPILKKCLDPTAQISAKASTRDVFLARLADTYLTVAEAYFKKDSNGSNALSYINEVRGRAKTTLATAGEITLDYILDERARETAGEYFRWNDLKRTGKLKEYASKYNSDIKNLINLGTDPFKGADGNDKILRPIPSSALDANKADMPQNPGY